MLESHIAATGKNGALAAGGLLGAIGASACCVLPLALAVAGIGGAWVGKLTVLAPYQPVFLGLGAASIGWGFWRTRLSGQDACESGTCGTPASRRRVRTVLWLGAVLLSVAATTEWWAALLV